MSAKAPFSLDELMAAVCSPSPHAEPIAPLLTASTMTGAHKEALKRLFAGVGVKVHLPPGSNDDDSCASSTPRALFEGLLASGETSLSGVARDFLDTFSPKRVWSRSIDLHPGGLPDRSDSFSVTLFCDGTICLRLSFDLPEYSDEDWDASVSAQLHDAKYATVLFAREIRSAYGPLLGAINSLTHLIAVDCNRPLDDPSLKMQVFEGLLSLEPGLARPYERKLAYTAATGGASDATPDASAAPRVRKRGRL